MVIPGILPGNYRILFVRADVANQERETNDTDNVLASPPTMVIVRSLTPGIPATGTLTPADRDGFFAVTVAPGDNLALVLDGLAASGVNELYVRRGAIPTRQEYDYRAVKGEFVSRGRTPARGERTGSWRDVLRPRPRRPDSATRTRTP